MNAFGQDFEEPIHDAVPLFRVEFGSELRRSSDVGEQDRHLLALAFERAPGGEDLLNEMFRRVGARIGGRSERTSAGSFAAPQAELGSSRQLGAAGGAAMPE